MKDLFKSIIILVLGLALIVSPLFIDAIIIIYLQGEYVNNLYLIAFIVTAFFLSVIIHMIGETIIKIILKMKREQSLHWMIQLTLNFLCTYLTFQIVDCMYSFVELNLYCVLTLSITHSLLMYVLEDKL